MEEHPDEVLRRRGGEGAELRRLTQARLDAGAEFTEATGAPPTVGSFGKSFLEKRRELGVRSVDDDESRLKTHVYPAIGSMRLDGITLLGNGSLVKGSRIVLLNTRA